MKKERSNIVDIIVLTFVGILYLYPFIWMIRTSLKTPQEALANPGALFSGGALQFETYIEVWKRLEFFRYFFNSISMSLGVVIGVVLLYSMAGFAIARLEFPGKEFIYKMFMAIMLVPGVTITIPLFIQMSKYNLTNTYWGLILPVINGGGPFAVLMFTSYFRSISHELYEASILEGAGIFRVYSLIYFPLALPVLATVGIMNFIGSWNTVLWPMVILTDKAKYTLPMGLMYLNSSAFTKWNELMAGAMFSIMPLIVIFILLQKYYIQGITSGAIKS